MKKFLFLIIILLLAIGAVYKMDIKPEVKDVVKQVTPAGLNASNPAQPENKANTVPSQIPSQNVPTQ